MTRFGRRLLAACCAWLLAWAGPALAQQAELQALDAVQTLANQNSARASAALQAGAQAWESSPFHEVRRTYLSTLIGVAFETGDMDQVQSASEKLLALAQSIHDDVGLALAQVAQAHRLACQGKSSEAQRLLERIEPVAQRSGDAEVLWLFHMVRSNAQNTSGQFEPAMRDILKSMDFALQRPRQAQASRLRSQVYLGLIHLSMKNTEKALKEIDDAQAVAQRLGATQTLGILHLNRGWAESGRGRLQEAMVAYRLALQVGEATGLVWLQASALNNMGDFHLIRKEYAQAEPLERRALAKHLEAGEGVGAAMSRANVGLALMGQGRIHEGAAEVKAALSFLRDAGARTTEELTLDELSRMYEQAGLYREAVETARAQQQLAKELLRTDREQAVAALQARFDAVQRERQIELLAHENRVKDAEITRRRQQQIATALGATATVLAGVFVALLYGRTRRANRDLHEAKRLADEALRDKSLFLATASHDLRQPVHAMSMLVEAIALRSGDAAIAPLIVDLRTSMQAMNQLFNALLDLSRLEAGGLVASPVPLALQPIVGEVARMFREQASTSGLELRLRLPRRGAFVLADPLLLRQALVNLTHNAIRYTPRGRVLIGVRRRGGDWSVEVWDTGIGIADGQEQQVFSPYFRGQQARNRDGAGHGLGLAVVARCARLMGATCGYQSRLGTGSRFWLRLPAGPAPGALEVSNLPGGPVTPGAARTTPADAAGLPPLQGRCLVLDDDPQVLRAWQAMLQGLGIDLRLASSGAEAMAHLDAGFVPSAIFCDQRLRSGESGFDVLRALLARCPQASGAMVSGELQSSALQAAQDEGYLVLRKPLEPAALHALLQHWLRQPAPQPTP